MSSSPIPKAYAVDALQKLSALAEESQTVLELALCHGSLVVIAYHANGARKGAVRPNDIAVDLIAAVRKELRLRVDWLETDIANFITEAAARNTLRAEEFAPGLMISVNGSLPLKRRWRLARETFAERLCSHHGRRVDEFAALAWRYGAGWPTRCLRPLILCFAPRYFEAEDFHLERAADCHRRDELAEELQYIRVSILRRGFWRHFGVGLNGGRLLRHYDNLVVMQVIAADAKRGADTNDRLHSAISGREQSPS